MNQTTLVSELVAEGALLVEDGNHGEYRPRPHEFVDDGTPFIRAADMTTGVVTFGTAGRIDPTARARIRKGVGQPGDAILSHKGTVGKVAVAPMDSPDFVCSPQTTFWRSTDPTRIEQRYLPYVLKSPGFRAQLNYLMGQTDMAPYVSLTDQRAMSIPVPPIEVQRGIAEVLGALDDKIAANAGQAATAMSLAGSMYASATVDAPREPLSGVLSPILGGTPARARDDYWSGIRPWASAKDVTGAWFGMVFDTEEWITELAVAETKAKPLPAGSVILTARGTVGAVARVTRPTSFNQSCYGFVPGTVPAGCMYFAIVDATTQAKQMAHGSVFDTITKRTFDHLSIPSFAGHQWSTLEARIGPLLALVESLGLESERLSKTRDSLLPGLMSGRIRVKDAERVVEEVV